MPRPLALVLAILALLPGCAALAPRPVAVERRLATLPAERLPLLAPVTIRWNAHLVPWIEAEDDGDLAFALGLVHGHLRGAQVALLRQVARGRLAEIAGPLATDIDHALRVLGFGRAAPAIIAAWPPETRAFMERFRDGLNHALLNGPRPPEFGLLGLRREAVTLEDLLAIGRLAGTDVNWLSWFSLLPQRGRPEFPALWARVLQAGQGQVPVEGTLAALLTGLSRAGSNTVAVSGARSTTGAPILANDPHLGMNLPNLWLVAGMRSPSFHAVGAMVPGLPFLGFGRNPDLAWGGTNMRAASSDLFDVSRLPPEAFREEEAEIRQRLWFSATRRHRVTEHGPVITDARIVPPAGAPLALRWIGHEPTDEITALLRAARARSGPEFRAAFARFGVSAQNMVWAERPRSGGGGGIGRLMAATLPDRPGFQASGPVLDAANPAHTAPWRNLRDARTLPFLDNPPDGVIASSNEPPHLWTSGAPPVGYFFSDADRNERLRQLLAARPRVTPEEVAAVQRDTRSTRAAGIAAGLLARFDALPGGPPEPALLSRLRGWDGDYRAESAGALVFELLLAQLLPRMTPEGGSARGPETGWNFITTFLLRDLDALPPERRAGILREAAAAAAPIAARFADWGEAHRLRAAHWLVNLPVLGRRFVLGDFPSGGSRETPMKTGHAPVTGRHEVTFGSMARHVSEMSDPDANWFVLWGGQDGWLGSAAFADQVPLWREGRMIRVPLRPETVAAEFPALTRLTPAR
ncbi:MAG: penicillin acylase family protein [Acetobacteraceae bacterium]|nr:penicillin acylase family protein [Acetobacteraceae bacterium]